MNNGLQDHWRNEDMLKEANVENTAIMHDEEKKARPRHEERRKAIEDIRAVTEKNIEGIRARGRP